MGSIVIDAVNHFFNPHSTSQHAAESEQPAAAASSSQQSRATSRSNTPMSVTDNRAVGSRAIPHIATAHHPEPARSESEASYSRQRPGRSSPNRPVEEDISAERRASQSDTHGSSQSSGSSASSPAPSMSSEESASLPRRIKVKDLAHIQSLADNDTEAFSDNGQGFRQKSGDQGPQYEISGMPIEHIIEMVAGLLTKITTANDMQHEHLHRQMPAPDSSAAMSAQTNSVLAFHGKNVPSITILSYLNRINKYCPTSYEVFISLLVYFDRMTEKVNSGPIQNLREMNQQATERAASHQGEEGLSSPRSSQSMEGVTPTGPTPTPTQTATPPMSGEFEKHRQGTVPGTPHSKPRHTESPPGSSLEVDGLNLSHFFVVDSFNIHRLVIAGVTAASKFFSDIFYTNSRYAKVSMCMRNVR